MIIPAAIRLRFEEIEPELEAVAREVRQAVASYCDLHGFAYAGRKKTLESLSEKIETGRYNKWSELDDLFGCMVVIPTLDRERNVLEFLREAFPEVTTKLRGSTRKSPEVFRFDATRFIGRLRPIRHTEPQELRFLMSFEVQIRSAFEHAWSVTTHALYKGSTLNWKTKRLVHQIKAAVEQLDTLVLALETSSGPIIEHSWPELNIQRTIIDRFSAFVSEGRIPDVLAPTAWSRFAENFYDLIRANRAATRGDIGSSVDRALAWLEQELPTDPLSIPHSLSLLQFVFGIVSSKGLLEPPLKGYCPLITEELLAFYPEVSKFGSGFLLQE